MHRPCCFFVFCFFKILVSFKSSSAELEAAPRSLLTPAGGVLFAMRGGFMGQEVAEFPLLPRSLARSLPFLTAIMFGCSLNHIAHHLSFLVWVSGASSRITSVIKRRIHVKRRVEKVFLQWLMSLIEIVLLLLKSADLERKKV